MTHTDPVPNPAARTGQPTVTAMQAAAAQLHFERFGTTDPETVLAATQTTVTGPEIPNPAPGASTPCSGVPCDTGPGEPCERHEREWAHTEGDHELCGPDCQAAAVEQLLAARASTTAQPDGQEPDCTCGSDDNTHDSGCATAARWEAEAAAEVAHIADDAAREEQQDRAITQRAHAAGDHQWCGITCEATFPSEALRATILCRAIPGSAAMLAELERRAAPGQKPEVRTAAPGGGTLRQRIETAAEHAITAWDADVPGTEGQHLHQAVAAAVLPLFVDHARELADLVQQRINVDRADNPGVLAIDRPTIRRGGMMSARQVIDRYADQLDAQITGDTPAPSPRPNPFRQLVEDVAAELHDGDPATYHGPSGPGDCQRCAEADVALLNAEFPDEPQDPTGGAR